MVTLRSNGLVLNLAPEAGGSVASLTLDGLNLLRAAPTPISADWDARNFASFPLVPFSGRIANGRFETPDKRVTLPPNMAPEPHAIHGQGWQSAWSVTSRSETSALLTLDHKAGDWPWAYQAAQHFTLSNNNLRLELSVTNLSEHDMPAGLGWHPYFIRKNASIQAATERVWLSGDDMIPAPPTDVSASMDLRQLRPVDQLDLDYAYDVSESVSRIEYPDLNIIMTADAVFQKLVVFVPPGENYFCVEPVTHAPDAVNSSLDAGVTGLRWLKQGETLSGQIILSVEA